MHPDEVATGEALVGRLLADQFPHWVGGSITSVDSYGTDHDIYRVGDTLAVRMPRIAGATDQAAKEGEWLPCLAPHLPLAVPVQRALGRPAHGYPFVWSVHDWLPGRSSDAVGDLDLDRAASDLARFVRALQAVDTAGSFVRPAGSRGGPLAERDASARQAIASLGDRIDGAAAARVWDEATRVPAWDGADVWLHGDLLPGNLLVDGGRLWAVIDFGGLNVGDPACDLQPAWNSFHGPSRDRFRHEVGADEAMWVRGRGWVLWQTVTALDDYWDTNPGMVRQASHALAQVLADR